jgi:DNA repair exonuclease SbcCD ATPase subunit
MEPDQVLKRVQWMEEARRKDKDSIALLENRILTLEGGVSAAAQQIKELNSEVTRLGSVVTRMDQYDNTLLQQRTEARRAVDELDKEIKKREEEADKVRRVELRALDNSIAEVRKELEVLPKYEKGIQARVEEDIRLRRSIDELSTQIAALRRDEDEYTRTYRLLEDSRRQDAKRLTDLQGEVAALRKRADDQGGKVEVLNVGLRKAETRLTELVNVETERRDAMVSFLDKQAITQVERDRVWKEWQTRFETIGKQAADIESQLLAMDTTHRDARRLQALVEELSQKVERRISEITEIQRLSEDRFRQEWVTFKADDQKRWINYTLTQEEQRNEMNRQFEKTSEHLTRLEDGLQEVQDLLAQVNELTEKRLQSLLAVAHDWVSTYERTVGRAR